MRITHTQTIFSEYKYILDGIYTLHMFRMYVMCIFLDVTRFFFIFSFARSATFRTFFGFRFQFIPFDLALNVTLKCCECIRNVAKCVVYCVTVGEIWKCFGRLFVWKIWEKWRISELKRHFLQIFLLLSTTFGTRARMIYRYWNR